MRFPLTLFQFLSILSLFCSYSASAQCLDNQKSSLLTLFGSSPIPSWTPKTDCCVWKGVTCDVSGHVTGLDLTNHGIRAPINSTSLTTLSSLRNLKLSSNLFNSPIPVSISGLSKLTHFNLSNSGFIGHVPVEMSRIKGLESLDLSFSNSLSSLRFKSHDFGHVIGNLSGLRELFLNEVDISSPAPESLGILSNLTSLHLSGCNLTGQFPGKIFQLQNLESTDLSANSLLSGTLPEFPSDSKLQTLSLSSTNFMGELPNSFGNLRYLRRLEVTACNFSGRIPSSLGRISQLSHFAISQNNFSGRFPPIKLPLALFHFLSIFSLLCSNSASAQCLHDQKSSLLTLFGSAPTPFWTSGTDCCLWKGITCDRSGHVTGLDLNLFVKSENFQFAQ
ncbi:hypothetical protein MRB53_000620 [Persea americana]|uniref:Uncharacterized protein n=1 Tax=Persea americana TaxID=3435 RepID=A0ACC2MRR1_PERAE|nr:hypothetical protein MRB53_000620 [Persea americana]